jgi:hypothetical protein
MVYPVELLSMQLSVQEKLLITAVSGALYCENGIAPLSQNASAAGASNLLYAIPPYFTSRFDTGV